MHSVNHKVYLQIKPFLLDDIQKQMKAENTVMSDKLDCEQSLKEMS